MHPVCVLSLVLGASIVPLVAAPQTAASHRCVAIVEIASAEMWTSNAAECATRLPPASTFKIPHALVALEIGAIAADTIEKWDGTQYADQPKWNRDQTVTTALRPSVLWFFQRIAPRVGAARMHEWLERLGYGNASTAGDVTMYWLNGTLRISAAEQASFLGRLYRGRLPFAPAGVRLVRDALEQPFGTAENAGGIMQLEGPRPPGVTWRPKTGRTTVDRRPVNWLVGDVTVGARGYAFAAVVWRDDAAAIAPGESAQLAVNTLVERGVIVTPPPR